MGQNGGRAAVTQKASEFRLLVFYNFAFSWDFWSFEDIENIRLQHFQ